MCFSAKASFAAAGCLTVISGLSLRKTASKKMHRMIPLALSPFCVALQQFCEGIVWLYLTNVIEKPLGIIGIYGFVVFAAVWWPIWIPLAIYCAENVLWRKRFLFFVILIGCITAALFFVSLCTHSIQIDMTNHHLYYSTLSKPFNSSNSATTHLEYTLFTMYLVAVLLPFFITRIPYAWTIGMVLGSSFIVSQLLSHAAAPSLWCFFAALSSGLVYWIITKQK